jgi:hypothetical protein
MVGNQLRVSYLPDGGTRRLWDSRLNLPVELYSHGLRERVGEAVAAGSYEAAIEQVGRHTGGSVPKRQAEQMSQVLATDFEQFYQHREIVVAQKSKPDLLVMSVDGKGIVMRHEDLRESTRQRAEGASHKLSSRLSRGEKRKRKRMATVATVYEVAPHQRKAGEMMDPEAKRRDPDADRPWVMLVDGQEEQLRQV